jgi:enterochelin esterase family protein
VPHGTITHHFYRSALIGDDRDFYVYTPPGYDPSAKTLYPVLYLFHGLGDDASGWTTAGRANTILDNLIAQGKAKPMIMVNTLGYGVPNPREGLAAVMAEPEKQFGNFSGAVLGEVLPIVEKTYKVAKDRNSRAVAGLSMGGAETFFVGLNNIDKFAYVAGFSSAFVMLPGARGAGALGRRRRYWTQCILRAAVLPRGGGAAGIGRTALSCRGAYRPRPAPLRGRRPASRAHSPGAACRPETG